MKNAQKPSTQIKEKQFVYPNATMWNKLKCFNCDNSAVFMLKPEATECMCYFVYAMVGSFTKPL